MAAKSHTQKVEKRKNASIAGMSRRLEAALDEAKRLMISPSLQETVRDIQAKLDKGLDQDPIKETAKRIDSFVEIYGDPKDFASLKIEARERFLKPRQSKTPWSGNVDSLPCHDVVVAHEKTHGSDIHKYFYAHLAMVCTCCNLIAEGEMDLKTKGKSGAER